MQGRLWESALGLIRWAPEPALGLVVHRSARQGAVSRGGVPAAQCWARLWGLWPHMQKGPATVMQQGGRWSAGSDGAQAWLLKGTGPPVHPASMGSCLLHLRGSISATLGLCVGAESPGVLASGSQVAGDCIVDCKWALLYLGADPV